MPNDERKGRRLGDETKERIADLASGWTVEGESPPPPELQVKREAPERTPRRTAKTQPPPPPGSPERKILEDKLAELLEEADADAPEAPPDADQRRSSGRLGADSVDSGPRRKDPSPSSGRVRAASIDAGSSSGRVRAASIDASSSSGRVRAASIDAGSSSGRVRAEPRELGKDASPSGRVRAASIDPAGSGRARPRVPRDTGVGPVPESDKTKENRGAVGVKHDKSASLTANAASGTIGDTPPPLFDRAAIAAGQDGALASDRVAAGSAPVPRTPDGSAPTQAAANPARIAGTGPNAAIRGAPKPPSADPAPHGAEPPAASNQRLTVPVGEFDEGQTIVEQDKLRLAYSQATIVRDAAGALLGEAEQAPAPVTPAALEPRELDHTAGDIARGDDSEALGIDFDAATKIAQRPRPPSPVRNPAALPRRPGLGGDLRYLATVMFGLRSARRELETTLARQTTRRQSRRHHLVTLGRTAVAESESLSGEPDDDAAAAGHPALADARSELAGVDAERTRHGEHIAAVEAELIEVHGERDATAKQHAADLAVLDADLVATAAKLAPLDRTAAKLRRRAVNHHEALRRIDAKVAAADASLRTPSDKLDPAAVQAEIATLRAERRAVEGDGPALAGELDGVTTQIAALEASRDRAEGKRAELVAAAAADQLRAEERLVANGAQRTVSDRAAAATEAEREAILRRFGERLCADRPDGLTSQLAPIDEIDAELGATAVRIGELREIVTSVDRWKLARGITWLVLIVAALGAGVAWLLDWLP